MLLRSPMAITKAYAVVSVADLAKSRSWYTKLLGREPDLQPMAEVDEWYFGDGGIQVVQDANRAGRSMLTLLVDDLDDVTKELEARGLRLGKSASSDFASLAQIVDLDGNQVTFAEPGPAQKRHRS